MVSKAKGLLSIKGVCLLSQHSGSRRQKDGVRPACVLSVFNASLGKTLCPKNEISQGLNYRLCGQPLLSAFSFSIAQKLLFPNVNSKVWKKWHSLKLAQ